MEFKIQVQTIYNRNLLASVALLESADSTVLNRKNSL